MISTMTPELLESLVTSYLLFYSSAERKMYNASNWSRGHIQMAISTESGGTVYYYSLMKIYNLQTQQELMKESISQLLLEAKQITEMEEFSEIDKVRNSIGFSVLQANLAASRDEPLRLIKNKHSINLILARKIYL